MQPGYAVGTCYACGRPWGTGGACQFCRQMNGFPVGVTLSSAGKRLLAYLVDGILCLVTCWIGWAIWSLIIFGSGQTPAKQLMRMRTVNLVFGTRAGWGRMFVREVLAKSLIGIFLGWLLIPYFWLLWDRNAQQLWDKLVDTTVVDDPHDQIPRVHPAELAGMNQSQPQLPTPSQWAPWETQQGSGQQGGYQQPGGYGQSGGYGQQGGYGQPQYPPPPQSPPER